MAVAESVGWAAVVTYARGIPPGRTGRAIDSFAVRLRWRGYRAVAVWEDGKFALAYIWRLIDMPRKLGHRQLLAELTEITRTRPNEGTP